LNASAAASFSDVSRTSFASLEFCAAVLNAARAALSRATLASSLAALSAETSAAY